MSENLTLGPYLGVSKSSGALVGLTAYDSKVKVIKTGPGFGGLVATYGKRVTLFTHKGGDVNVVVDWSLPGTVTRSNTFCTPCVLLPGKGVDGSIALCAVQMKSAKSRQAKIRLVYWKGNAVDLREANYIDTPDDFEMSGRCALHPVGSSDCLLISLAGQVLLYSCKQSQKAEALLQLWYRAPSLHLPQGFEIVWTSLSGSNLASSTALLTIGKDPGGRGHLVTHTVSSVSGAVIPLKRHLLLHPNPTSAAYQESESMLLVSSRITDKSPDCICGYALRSGGSSLMHVFTMELNCDSIPGRIVNMGGLPFSKWLMVLDDTPRIRFYSTRYGANLGKTVPVPDSMKEGILGASTAIFPDGSAMAVISSIGILVCPFPGYLVGRQYHAGSLASIVGSNKRQREEDTEETTEEQHATCVDFRRCDQANLKDALTSTKEQIPIACNDWPMIPGAVCEDNIRDTLLAIHKASKAKGQGKKSCSEQMSAALTKHTMAMLKMANEENLRMPKKYRKPVHEDKLMYQEVAHEAIAVVMSRSSDEALWNTILPAIQCGKISIVMIPGLVHLASNSHMWTALEYIFASVVDVSERDIVWALRLAMRELSKEDAGGRRMPKTRNTCSKEIQKLNESGAESNYAISSLKALTYAALRAPYNEAFLREAVSEVSSTEALVLLQNLCCLLQEGNFRESVPLNHHSKKRLRIHKSEQLPSKSAAVGWIAALLEAHFIGLSHCSKLNGTIVETLLCEARAEILDCESMLTMKGLIDGLKNLQHTGCLKRPPAFSYETLRF